jgi:predicted small integral membrane protein
VWRKAVAGDETVDDSQEIMSSRAALICLVSGYLIMAAWLTLAGMPLWAALSTLVLALAIFVGLTRVETGQ